MTREPKVAQQSNDMIFEFEKSISDELFLFLQKCRIWPFFRFCLIRIRFFWAQGIKSEGVLGRMVNTKNQKSQHQISKLKVLKFENFKNSRVGQNSPDPVSGEKFTDMKTRRKEKLAKKFQK